MEIGVPTSFIPHDATTPTESRHYDSGGGLTDLLMLLAIVFFVASAALAAGSFLYLQYLGGESASKQAQIQEAQAAFDPGLIQSLTVLDDRMNAANTILSAHIAPSAFFAALDETTAATVSFQSLDFDATDPQNISLKLSGVARDINSIAYQALLFGKPGVITNAIFSGINQQADGVHFTVAAQVNPAAINYETLVTGQTPAGENSLPASSSTPPQAAPSGVISPFGASGASGASSPTTTPPPVATTTSSQ